MMYTVGSVPYLNAKPLVRLFEDLGERSPVKVVYDVPSRLPAMLKSGAVQAIMVSSIEALRHPGTRIANGVCIGTLREVLSVRIFSKVSPDKIQTLALDQSSMTSNALAEIVLDERYGVSPVMDPMAPDYQKMLANHDACVLIGDNGMREQGEVAHILDLGLEWFELTGRPFVWAVWMGNNDLSPELAGWLVTAQQEGACRMDAIVADAPEQTGLPPALCNRYLRDIMHYPMEDRELDGLREFGRLLVKHGLLKVAHWPEIVAPQGSSDAGV